MSETNDRNEFDTAGMSEQQAREVQKLQARAGGMLPGVAAICMYMLVLTITNAFAAINGSFGTGGSKYGRLALCTLLAAGIFGLLRLRRWGWALVLGACLTLFLWYAFAFRQSHAPQALIQGLFLLVFFLYLVRTEVRERLL
jgi:hypothetical protein